VCKEDKACPTTGTVCVSPSTLANCARDEFSCLFETVAQETCASGACLGAPGAATCCAQSCENTPTRCESASTIGICFMNASGCATFGSSSCDTGTVCERTSPAACVDPGWAEWPMPNSAADVAAGAPNPTSYTVDNQHGIVTDNVTGLMWQQNAREAATFDIAVSRCQEATDGGFTDWRLPSLVELISIGDFSRVMPSIDQSVFPPGHDNWNWTTTILDNGLNEHFTVNFFLGQVLPLVQEAFGSANIARCVR
jgi:hypothetical protein